MSAIFFYFKTSWRWLSHAYKSYILKTSFSQQKSPNFKKKICGFKTARLYNFQRWSIFGILFNISFPRKNESVESIDSFSPSVVPQFDIKIEKNCTWQIFVVKVGGSKKCKTFSNMAHPRFRPRNLLRRLRLLLILLRSLEDQGLTRLRFKTYRCRGKFSWCWLNF